MADSILRLRVQSDEYDNKLKQATNGLTRYIDECRKAGGTLGVVKQETLDYVRALGQMDTTSRTATGKLAEMKKTFTELSVVYKNMTDEEKKSPFGKTLAASLDQLKGRISESKVQLDDINKSINGGGGLTGALDAVAGKFGLSIDQVTKFGSVLGVATTAAQVAKDAFFQSESGIDEWGRTVEGAKGAYNIFLDTLNNGNWSNFFQNLQTAIQGGRDLYDIFDRLGSIKSNNAAAIAMVQQQIAQLRLAKQQGENVDAQLKEATARLAQLQKQSITAGKAAGNKSAFEVIRNGVNSVGGARYNEATINYVIGNIMKNGQSEFDKYRNNYQALRNRGMVTKTQTIYDSQGGTYERQYKEFDINALTKEQQKQYSIAKAITEGETRIQKGIAAYAQAVQEGTASAREEFKGNRYALQGSGGGGGGRSGGGGRNGRGNTTTTKQQLTETQKNQQEISKLTTEYQMLSDKVKKASESEVASINKRMEAIRNEIKLLQDRNAEIQYQADVARGKYPATMTAPEPIVKPRTMNPADTVAGVIKRNLSANGDKSDVKALPELTAMEQALTTLKEQQELYGASSSEVWQSYQQQITEVEDRIKKFKRESVGAAQATTKSWNTAASAINTVSSAIALIKDPAAKIMATIGQAIANVALAYSETLAKDPHSKSNIYAFIAAAASAMVSMVSTISTIKSSTKYAEGGIIQGNSYSGDNIQANNGAINLDAGELILNRAQQGVIAASLSDNKAVPVMQPYVDCELVFVGMNNTSKRHGRGEIVTTSTLRKYGLIP